MDIIIVINQSLVSFAVIVSHIQKRKQKMRLFLTNDLYLLSIPFVSFCIDLLSLFCISSSSESVI